MALARALGFRLPGPEKARTRDQIHIFWQRALRVGLVPTHETWNTHTTGARFWWYCWPPAEPSGYWTRHRAQSTLPNGKLGDLDRDVGQMEATVVLLYEVLVERALRGEGPEPPVEMQAEVARLLASGRVILGRA